MLSHLSRRLAALRISPPLSTTTGAARPLLVSLPNTRSFLPSTRVWVSSTTTANTTAKPTAKKAPKTTKTATKPKTKKVPKPKKPAPVKIPRQYSSPPPYGPSLYTHWFSKHYLPSQPRVGNRDELMNRARNAGAAFKLLSDHEKQEMNKEILPLREAATKARQEWINDVPPPILKELNKRRATKSKKALRKHHTGEKRPLTSFFRYLKEYQATQTVVSVTAVARQAAENWRDMSEKQKEPYLTAAKAGWDEYNAKHAEPSV